MFENIGVGELILVLLWLLLPLLVVGWLLSLANRAVRALESIAQSLREPRR